MMKRLFKTGQIRTGQIKTGQIISLVIVTLVLVLCWQQLSLTPASSAQISSTPASSTLASSTPASAAQILAQSTTQLESRVSRLESENTTLRSQLNQLQTSVARLGRNSGVELPQPTAPNPSVAIGSGLADDPVFKRLATLVIELKERVDAVEARLPGGTAPR